VGWSFRCLIDLLGVSSGVYGWVGCRLVYTQLSIIRALYVRHSCQQTCKLSNGAQLVEISLLVFMILDLPFLDFFHLLQLSPLTNFSSPTSHSACRATRTLQLLHQETRSCKSSTHQHHASICDHSIQGLMSIATAVKPSPSPHARGAHHNPPTNRQTRPHLG
jgi:hypothetical protein